MIDLHAHILPGIDDGAADIYETLEMAAIAVESGVTKIVATPHCNVPGYFDNRFGKAYVDAYGKALDAIQREGIPLEILPGAEAFATYDLPDLLANRRVMPLNRSKYILMEFAFDEEPDFANDVLKRAKAVGVRPVIAHAERYQFVQDNLQMVREWVRKGYVIQANKGSFMGRFGVQAEKTAYQMLDKGWLSVIASDAHGVAQRTPYMMDAYEHLRQRYSEKELDILFHKNPERICEDRPILRKKVMD